MALKIAYYTLTDVHTEENWYIIVRTSILYSKIDKSELGLPQFLLHSFFLLSLDFLRAWHVDTLQTRTHETEKKNDWRGLCFFPSSFAIFVKCSCNSQFLKGDFFCSWLCCCIWQTYIAVSNEYLINNYQSMQMSMFNRHHFFFIHEVIRRKLPPEASNSALLLPFFVTLWNFLPKVKKEKNQ